jgi:uncharacterized protein
LVVPDHLPSSALEEGLEAQDPEDTTSGELRPNLGATSLRLTFPVRPNRDPAGPREQHARLASPAGPLYDPGVTREEVQSRLSEQRAELTKLGVRSLDIFGSVARGESAPGSDVDLLIDFDRPVGLFHFFRVQQRLEQILGCSVDLVMLEAVKPQLRERIFREAVRAT